MLDKNNLIRIGKLLANLALDYLRWTQLIPMILCWAFACAMIGGLLLFGAHEAMQADPDRFEEMLEQAEPVLVPLIDTVAPVVSFMVGRGDGLTAEQWVIRIWGWLALLAMLLSWLRTAVFGPREPWPFRRKIVIVALAAAVYAVLILAAIVVLGADASTLALVLNTIFFPLVLVGVSAWGLGVSHLVSKLQAKLAALDEADLTALWTRERA